MAYDLGQTTICMALAATDLGVGSAHAAVHDQDLARDLLDLPDDRELVHLLELGYPADRSLERIREPDRRPFDDVVHRDRWRPATTPPHRSTPEQNMPAPSLPAVHRRGFGRMLKLWCRPCPRTLWTA